MKLQVFFEELDVEYISEQRSYEVSSIHVLCCGQCNVSSNSNQPRAFCLCSETEATKLAGDICLSNKHANQWQ